MRKDGSVGVGPLTRNDLKVLGRTFARAWPVEEAPCFGDLLHAIDEADRETRRPASPADRR